MIINNLVIGVTNTTILCISNHFNNSQFKSHRITLDASLCDFILILVSSFLSKDAANASTTRDLLCPPLVNNHYSFTYSCNMGHEAGILGVVSLFLTLLNIVCIFIMCVIVLKVSEELLRL